MRNADLEREILAGDHDPAAYLVYADWLQSHGDPRGELIIRQLHDRDAQAYLDEHRVALLGRFATDPPETFELEWRGGFIRKAVVGWITSNKLAPPRELEEFLRHDSAALLEELLLGPTAHPRPMELHELATAIEATRPIALRTLFLGDTRDYDISDTRSRMPSSASIRGLHHLSLRGGSIELGEIDLPELRTFIVESGALTVDNLNDLAKATWPALESLEIWFGDPLYGATGGAGDIAPLFAQDVPRLRSLGLRNCAFIDELVAQLVGSPLLAQLSSLDLSMGNLSDRGLATLITAKSELRHLTSIVLHDNALSAEAMQRAHELPNAVFGVTQHPERAVPRGPRSNRHQNYVSVGE